MDENEFMYDMIKNFIIKNQDLASSMMRTDQNLDFTNNAFSDWHLEGSVWTHTMMVLSHLKEISSSKELFIAGLLHDIGKTETYNFDREKQKVTFYGHPGVSTFMAVEILNQMSNLNSAQKEYILRVINYHDIFIKNYTEDYISKIASHYILHHLEKLHEADTKGSFSNKQDKGLKYDFKAIRKTVYNNLDKKLTIDINKTATILIGLPYSGKSSFVNNQECKNVISRDNIVMAFGMGKNYNDSWASVDHKLVDKFRQSQFIDAIKKGQSIIVDETNLTHKKRNNMVTELRKRNYMINYVMFLPEMKTIYKRRDERKEKFIAPSIIFNMMKSFEFPFYSEYDNMRIFF